MMITSNKATAAVGSLVTIVMLASYVALIEVGPPENALASEAAALQATQNIRELREIVGAIFFPFFTPYYS